MPVIVRRLAVAAALVDAAVDVECATEDTVNLLDCLTETGHKGVLELVNATSTIRAVGMAWRTHPSIELANAKGPVVVIKGAASFATPITQWKPKDVKLEFYNAEKARIGSIVVSAREEFVEVTLFNPSRVFDDEIEFKGTLKTTLLELFATSAPTVDSCLAALPSGLHIEHSVFNAKKAMLPEWMVSAFLAYLSHHWRLHVLSSACQPINGDLVGDISDYFVDRGVVDHITTREGAAARRVSFYFHSSHCHCTHHQTTFAPATHQTTILRLEFCGCLDCPYHGTGFASQSAVCTQGLRLKLLCLHNPDTPTGTTFSKSECTCVFDVPAEDGFSTAFARHVVLLSHQPTVQSAAESKRDVLAALETLMQDDDAKRSDTNMELADATAEALLRGGFVWSKRGGKFGLRKRKRDDEPIRAFMKIVAKRYCHLFPNA